MTIRISSLSLVRHWYVVVVHIEGYSHVGIVGLSYVSEWERSMVEASINDTIREIAYF